jgi:hypothetical protein
MQYQWIPAIAGTTGGITRACRFDHHHQQAYIWFTMHACTSQAYDERCPLRQQEAASSQPKQAFHGMHASVQFGACQLRSSNRHFPSGAHGSTNPVKP